MKVLQKRVLVVDDDPIIGRSFSGVLSGRGYAVITARDGEEALKKIQTEKYDIVFTDIKMPGISGIEVARRIKATQPWLPVVIITGYGSGDNRKQAEELGVSDFLDKPLSPDTIERSTAEALQKAEAATTAASEQKPAAEEVPKAEADTAEGVEGDVEIPQNLSMYFTAPFEGLSHAITLPIEGLNLLGSLGEQRLVKSGAPRFMAAFLKRVAVYSVAPFMVLAYLAALPVAGVGILAWLGVRELAKLLGIQSEAGHVDEASEATAAKPTHTAAQHAAPQKDERPDEKAVAETTPGPIGSALKTVLLFFTAPFAGLVYVITFPFIGLAALASLGARELVRTGMSEKVATRIKNIALFLVAPFIGLAYMLVFPIVGLSMLVWMGIKAATGRNSK